MSNRKHEQLLERASKEMKELLSGNHLMSAKLDVFEKCAMMVAAPVPTQGWTHMPDLVHEIDEELRKLQSQDRVGGDK